jgi:arylsulfatase A-like enzyme
MTRAALLLFALLVACKPDCTPAGGEARPIVLLITVDTLRADHLASYGSSRVRTPHLDRLGAEGARFAHVWSAANVTVPSHTSIFTSQPLARHGVVSNQITAVTDRDTVQDAFNEAGYRTAAFVSAYHLGPKMLFGSLLDRLELFEAPRRVSKPWTSGETVDRTLAWMRGACRDRAFAWVHLWDPHMPYAPPAPFDRAYYAGDPRDPRNTSLSNVEFDWILHDMSGLRHHLARHARAMQTIKRRLHVSSRQARGLVLYPDALRRASPDQQTYDELFAVVRPVQEQLHHALPFDRRFAGFLAGIRDVEYPRALYAGEVSYVDQEVGRLVDTLDGWGLRDRLVVVVTADHGEGLGDHGIYFNHVGLWEPIIRVPFIVWAPGRVAPRVHEGLVTGLDVAPTLLQLVGLPVPASMEGQNALADQPADRAVVSETVQRWQIALRDARWKVVRTLSAFYVTDAFHREAGDVELYDLVHDPDEHTNLATAEPARLAAMNARLDAWMAAHGVRAEDGPGAPAPPAISPDDRARLRALGYAD